MVWFFEPFTKTSRTVTGGTTLNEYPQVAVADVSTQIAEGSTATATFYATDDGTIEKFDVYLNGQLAETYLDSSTAFSWSLVNGDQIVVVATDNQGLSNASNIQYYQAVAGEVSKADWTLSVGQAGPYELYAQWPVANDLDNNVVYQIDFTNAQGQAKTVNTSVNQTINGDALLIADELAAYSEIKVSINNNTTSDRIFAGEVSLISTKPTPTPASFTWDISSLSSGDYEVFAKMPSTANAALSTSATYYMILNGNSAAGIDSVRNITTETDQVSLGEITITQDINNQITLSGNSANGLLYADALMFVPDMGPPVYVTSTDMYFVHSDHLGTPKLLTDENQIVQWSIQTTPYGMLFQSEGTVSNIKAFPGQYVDEETGYSYNYFRDYDPSLGRYIQTDPIGLKGGLNTYGYVGGNPVSFVDPLGLEFLIGGSVFSDAFELFSDEYNSGVDHFLDNYDEMKARMVIGADQYYHCMANCQATLEGDGGEFAAHVISKGRECVDFPKNTLLRGLSVADALSDMSADLTVNKLGRQAAKSGGSCDATCRPLLPLTSEPLIPIPGELE